MVNAEELREMIGERAEWLLTGSDRRSFALTNSEIEITTEGARSFIGFIDDGGYRSARLLEFRAGEGEIVLETAGSFGRNRETLTLSARELAADLAAEIEAARLQRANEIAGLIRINRVGTRITRVSLNETGGRLAHITFELQDKTPVAAISDVTASVTAESLFAAAMLWVEKLGMRRKNPIQDIWILCEKRYGRNSQKLHALLAERWKAKITVVEIDRKKDPPALTELPKRRISDLWREKAKKLTLPVDRTTSGIAETILRLAPGEIDVVRSRQGETLRFNGVPFARVRELMGVKAAWFGIGRERRLLTDDTWDEFARLVSELKTYRRPKPPNRRHAFYRAAPEAWLESILRRDIATLDANLVLSPIYNQFRSSTDKIDLLAIRRDGRLVVIELKTQPDREVVFQAADYWRKIELQRRRGILAAANLFDGREIADRPAIVYLAAPAWSFHRDFEYFAKAVSPEIEIWRFDLHEDWRQEVRVVGRQTFSNAERG
jgi:hypothetical protein